MSTTLLKKILQPGAISTVFQPIYKHESSGCKPVILECLSRGPASTNATHAGVLFEYAQLKAAEPLVDRACLTAALTAVAAMALPIRISLNVFAATLVRDADFVHWIAEQTQHLNLNPSNLVFEIVESGEAWDAQAFRVALSNIRALGSAIALDDVGLAHSNFQRILECDPDFLKLDQCIVRDCHKDSRRRALLKCLASLARDLKLSLIAEGVETWEELNTVCEYGLSFFQGFLFCKPVSAMEIVKLVDTTFSMTAIPFPPGTESNRAFGRTIGM